MKPNILFADMTGHFLPVIASVAERGFTPYLAGGPIERIRNAGIECHTIIDFAPHDLQERIRKKLTEISESLSHAFNLPGVKKEMSSFAGNFMPFTGERFFRKFLEIANSEIEITECFLKFIEKHPLELVVLRTEMAPFERVISRLASQHNIPTLHVAHALWGAAAAVKIPGEYGQGLESDYVSVFGDRARKGMLSNGVEPERVFLTGSPYWDDLYTGKADISREEACRRLQLDPDKPIVLFCTGHANPYHTGYLSISNKLLENHKAVLEAVKQINTNIQVIIRPHPTEFGRTQLTEESKQHAINAYTKWISGLGIRHVHVIPNHKIEAFRSAHVAIMFGSSNVIVDSMILECPSIVLGSGGVFSNEDGIVEINDIKKLPDLLKMVLENREKREEIIRLQKKALPDLNYGNDGKARERLADLIVRLSKEPHNHIMKEKGKTMKQEDKVKNKGNDEQLADIVVSGLIPTERAVIDINRSCNAKCLMCYHAYSEEHWSKTFNDVKLELDAAKQRGNTSIDFTGGEPTIYPQMDEVISYAESIGLHTCIITNGLSLEKVKKLVSAGCREWLVSIHGYREQHDNILGVKDAWSKVNETIRYLNKQDCFIRVNCTLTRYNFQDLPALANHFAESVNAKIANFINFNPHYYWGKQGDSEIFAKLNQVQANVSEISPYLKQALDILSTNHLWTNVRYFPLCLLKGYETHICNNPQVMFDPYEWDYGVIPKSVKAHTSQGNYLQEAINSKEDTCGKCGMRDVCGGVNRNYAGFHGYSELSPYSEWAEHPYHFARDVEADIIVPAYKSNENLMNLIQEIGRKTVPPYNLIVVNRYQSASKNRNYGLERSQSPFVIMCDDDLKDLPMAWNRKLIYSLRENKDLLGISARLLNSDGTPGMNTANNFDLKDPLVKVEMIPTACSVFRKTDIRFDEKYIRAGWEDTDFFKQLKQKHGKGFAIANTIQVVHLNKEREGGGAGNQHNRQAYMEKWHPGIDAGQRFGERSHSIREEEAVKADKLYQEVNGLVENGNNAEAVKVLEKILKINPAFALAHNDIGVLLFEMGDRQKALKHYQQASRLDPMNVVFQKNLADYYFVEAGNVEEALRIYNKVLAIEPKDIETLLAMAHICISLNKTEDAEYFYNRVLEIEPWNTDAKQLSDQLAVPSHDQINPISAEEMHQKIKSNIEKGLTADAIAAFQEMLQQYPDFAVAHNDLGVLYYKKGDNEKALAHYEEAARLEPDNPIFQKNLADLLYIELGSVEQAMKIYLEVLKHNPKDVEILLIMGHVCVSMKKFDDATHFYNRVLEVEPWHVEAREFLEKIDHLGTEDAISESPGEMYEGVKALLDGHQDKEAMEALERLLDVFPDYALAHNDLGVLCYKMGDKVKTLEHYKKAADCEPDNVIFRKNLADFYYFEEGRTESAMEIYVGILGIDSKDVEVLMTMGHICVGLERTEDAEHFYNRVLEVEPWHRDAREILDRIQLQSQQLKQFVI